MPGYFYYTAEAVVSAANAAGLAVSEWDHISEEIAHTIRGDAAFLMNLFQQTRPAHNECSAAVDPTAAMNSAECSQESSPGAAGAESSPGVGSPPDYTGMAGLTVEQWMHIRQAKRAQFELNLFGDMHTPYFDESPMHACYFRMTKSGANLDE